MGTTRTLAAGEAFVEGRSQANAKALVEAAKDLDAKGSVRTTYDGYIAPVEVVEASGLTAASTGEVKDTAEDQSEQKQDENPAGAEFDPSTASVDEVKEYLDGADDAERARVLAAEAEGKKRKTILDLNTQEAGK